MKLFLAVLGALMLAASQASAAIITYSMVFKDQTGAEVGTGGFSFDRAVKVDVLVDPNEGGPCGITSDQCVVGATWTSLNSLFAVFGSERFDYVGPFRPSSNLGLFAEGGFFFDPRDPTNALKLGNWLVGDGDLPSLFIDFGSLNDQLIVRTYGGSILTPTGAMQLSGTVEFVRQTPVPAPAGAALFVTGLAAYGAARARKALRAGR